MDKKLFWFSRHPLTNGQEATIKTMGFNAHEQHNIIFNDDIVNQIKNITNSTTIAVVAPLKYGLILLREGFTIIEFENIPSARERGIFLCKGAWIHTLQESKFFPCPISLENQETGSLNYEEL